MSVAKKWERPCNHPDLPKGAVHVWHLDADSEAVNEWYYREVLSPDERSRASCFRLAVQQTRYIVGRGILRLLCGRYLRVEPDQLSFAYGAWGKPFLAVHDDALRLHFNVSHAENIVLYAFARDRAVGVDVEQVRADTDIMTIARRWFTPRETEVIGLLSAREQRGAFFRFWTRKEAYLKAVGDGLGS